MLFEPAAAYRSANGVVLSWWLADEPGDATLEIVDASGDVVRTFEPAVEGEERDRWAGPALPLEAGLNRLALGSADGSARDLPGDDPLGRAYDGARGVAPGTYTARLTVGDRSETTEVEVRPHPWITDVTEEDLVAQYEFGVEIRDRVHQANSAVIAIRNVKAQLDERLEASDDERLAGAGERLRESASAVEADIYQVRNQSNQDPLNFPIRVNNRLANLLSMSEQGDGRPGSGMYAVYEIMVERLDGHLTRLQAVWEDELAEVNAELRRLGMDEIEVETAAGLLS